MAAFRKSATGRSRAFVQKMSAEHADKAEFHGISSTGGKAAFWEKKASKASPSHENTQDGPGGSDDGGGGLVWDGTCYRQKLAGKDDSYGRPPPGSKTEKRGQSAGSLITSEVVEVCYNILRIGLHQTDGTFIVSFGFLFEFYTKVSNKLVGMLLRARRQGLIHFEGEMLFQRRDDDVIIKLVKIPKALEKSYEEAFGEVPEDMRSDH